jgi:hypothetical protein
LKDVFTIDTMGKKSLEVQKKRVQEESTHIVATTNKLMYKRDLTYGICENERNNKKANLLKEQETTRVWVGKHASIRGSTRHSTTNGRK